MGRIFGTALAGNCQKRPELVDAELALEVTVEVIRARGGADILRRLFEPLGYEVDLVPIPLNDKPALLPMWVSRNLSVPDPPVVGNGVVFAISTGENTLQRHTDP